MKDDNILGYQEIFEYSVFFLVMKLKFTQLNHDSSDTSPVDKIPIQIESNGFDFCSSPLLENFRTAPNSPEEEEEGAINSRIELETDLLDKGSLLSFSPVTVRKELFPNTPSKMPTEKRGFDTVEDHDKDTLYIILLIAALKGSSDEETSYLGFNLLLQKINKAPNVIIKIFDLIFSEIMKLCRQQTSKNSNNAKIIEQGFLSLPLLFFSL